VEGPHAPHRPGYGPAVVERRSRARRDFKTCASGAPDYAIMACTNLIEGGKLDKREQAIAYTNRGVAFRIRGGVQRALADLNRAIELDSSLAPIYANRGLVYMYMGEPDPALADFNRALELDPNNPLSTSTAAPSINA
jgi:tetratricopeptide (TPR) repeat protein